MSTWFSNIQLGFDMATSLTIVGAAITWTVQQKTKPKLKRFAELINAQHQQTYLNKIKILLQVNS